jgi:hypothetical protein
MKMRRDIQAYFGAQKHTDKEFTDRKFMDAHADRTGYYTIDWCWFLGEGSNASWWGGETLTASLWSIQENLPGFLAHIELRFSKKMYKSSQKAAERIDVLRDELIEERPFGQNGYAVHSVRQIIKLVSAKIHVLHISVYIRPSSRCSAQRCNISGWRLADSYIVGIIIKSHENHFGEHFLVQIGSGRLGPIGGTAFPAYR